MRIPVIKKANRPRSDTAVIRAAIYARCSTEEQAEAKHSTIETQVSRCRSAIESRSSVEKKYKLAGTYQDEGASGKNMDRAEFQRMMEDVRAGKIDVLLATRLDRISRSTMDFLGMVAELDAMGVGISLLDESLDSSTPTGRFAMTMMVALAQLERENVSQRIDKKMVWRAQQGLWNGSQTIGYVSDPDNPGVLKPVPEEVKLVSLIFRKYLELGSANRVADFL